MKKEGFALSLSAGGSHELDLYSDFQVRIGLTQKGLFMYDDVAQAVFAYVNMLVEKGPQLYIHEECKKIGNLKFDFAEKTGVVDYVKSLASIMKKFTTEEDIPHLLRHQYIADVFDEDRIKQMTVALAVPENSMMFLTSKKFKDEQLPLMEKWYSIRYSSNKYSQCLRDTLILPGLKKNGKVLDLPLENVLLPTNFDLLPSTNATEIECVKKWDNGEVWYKKDDKFLRPKGIVNMRLYTTDCQFAKTPQGRLFAEVWLKCLKEFTREFTYMAKCASLDFTANLTSTNVAF